MKKLKRFFSASLIVKLEILGKGGRIIRAAEGW